MTSQTVDITKHRPAVLAWLIWIGSVVAVASVWCVRKVIGPKKPLTRAEERRRRKALVREAMSHK